MPPATGRKFAGLPSAFGPYKALRQWVGWKYVQKPGEPKPRKVPINPASREWAKTNDPASWGTYEEAATCARRHKLAGVGFVLTADDGLTGVDLDDCRDPATGELSELAAKVVAACETYTEVSPSGTGLRLFAEGKIARTFTFKDGERKVEVYPNGRYLTVTGDRVAGTPDAIGPAPVALALLRDAHRAVTGGSAAASGSIAPAPVGGEPREGWGAAPAFADVEQACPQARHAADPGNQPKVTEPQWHALLGLMPHCEDGRAAAHRCSEKHPDYSAGETDAKFDRLAKTDIGPTTCAVMAERFGAERCASCSFRGVVKSPVPAGRRLAKDHLAQAGGAPVPLRVIAASDLANRPVPARAWLVRDVIPDRNVTLLAGDGGTGKSLLALQLAFAVATGTDFLGMTLEAGPALYLSAEDEEDEMHRRLDAIAAGAGLSLADLDGLHIAPLAGVDAVLAAPAPGSDLIAPRPLWAAAMAKVAELRPRLVVVDNLADVFAGNENSRPQARQFVALLRGLALDHALAVVLLGHPSLTGMSSGTSTSGSTAWSNSVRARLYLDRLTAVDGMEPDPDLRVLRTMKANYAAIGAEVRVRWEAGRFKLDGAGVGAFDRMAAGLRAERVFLELLRRFAEQGREVSDKRSPSFAPAVFAKEPGAEGCGKEMLVRAMGRLLMDGRIKVEHRGPPSRRYSRIVLADA